MYKGTKKEPRNRGRLSKKDYEIARNTDKSTHAMNKPRGHDNHPSFPYANNGNFLCACCKKILVNDKGEHMVNDFIMNCGYDCGMNWYCKKCSVIYRWTENGDVKEIKTCGICFLTRLQPSCRSQCSRISWLSDEKIAKFRIKYRKDLQNIHIGSLKGKVIDGDI
jgi:hypothetical protein